MSEDETADEQEPYNLQPGEVKVPGGSSIGRIKRILWWGREMEDAIQLVDERLVDLRDSARRTRTIIRPAFADIQPTPPRFPRYRTRLTNGWW